MGNSKALSGRGNWQALASASGKEAELDLKNAIRLILNYKYPGIYEVRSADTLPILENSGIEPDIVIIHRLTSNRMFIDSKKQKAEGNTEERAARFLPCSGLVERIMEFFGLEYFPVAIVASGDMVDKIDGPVSKTSAKYLERFRVTWKMAPDLFFAWHNKDISLLANYLDEWIVPRLEGKIRERCLGIKREYIL